MKFNRSSLRPFATIAAGLFMLVACQNATDSNSNNDKPVVVTASFPIAAPRIPDSAAWIFQKDTVAKSPSCPDPGNDGTTNCTETFHLPQSPGTDSVALQLWTLGIRTYTLYFKESGSSTALTFGSASVESLDTMLLSRFANLSAAQKATLAPSDTGRSGLVAYYASLILSGDAAFAGKPLPVGMNADSVKKDLVLLGIKEGMTSAKLTALSVPLDNATIHAIAGALVQADLLKTADTLDWFHPVRVDGAGSVTGSLVAGGSAVVVTGAFSWNAGAKVSLAPVSVHTPQGVDNADFQFPTRQFVLGSTDTIWSLSGNLTVLALATAAVGWDTLWVTLSMDSTHAATLRIPFQVVAAPPATPKIVLLAPANQIGNTLAQSTDSLYVSWGVSNWVDVNPDSVFINSLQAVPLSDSTWGQNVYVYPNGQVSTITFRAVGKNGPAATSFVQATRAKDTIGPTITWLNPSTSISVDATVSSYKVQVKVTDLSGVNSVYLQGLKANNDSGSYWSATVPLPSPNGLPVKLVAKAWDKLKNLNVDSTSVSITRNVPSGTDAPTLVRVSPVSNVGNTLPFASDTLHVAYNITDLVPLDSTKIIFGTVPAKHMPDSTWVADVPVPFNGQPYDILIQAANIKGNGTLEHIGVTRAKDLVPPTIVKGAGTVSQAVPWATKSISLSWTVKDNYKMSTLALNRQPQSLDTLLAGNYPLAVGSDSFVVAATDSFGNASADTIVITRGADTTLPLIVPQGVPTSLPYVKMATVVFAISDNDAVSSVLINHLVPTQSGNAYTAIIPLVPGPNPVVVVAKDPTGNSAMDSLSIQATDNDPPTIAPTTVPVSPMQYAKTTTVSFTVTDNDTVTSVLINNQTPMHSGNTYTATLQLLPGSNPIVVVATDRAGNPAKDSLNIQTVLRDRDGNLLRFGLMPDGKIWTLQDLWTNPSSQSNDLNYNSPAACINDSCSKYGDNYSWAQAMDQPAICDSAICPQKDSLQHQGLCPANWHIPTPTEWSGLIQAAAGAGGTVKQGFAKLLPSASEGNYWGSTTPDPQSGVSWSYGTDDFGFTLFPSGEFGASSSGWSCADYYTATLFPQSDGSFVEIHVSLESTGAHASDYVDCSAYAIRCVAN
jgi:uncharacterized protein (TIGR02145 family)